ncbi:MAG: hypothetical protein IT239_07500, partial [Bacteroidia bacterium]|nr:hypothetical protein [Bacteroidia bacterium]
MFFAKAQTPSIVWGSEINTPSRSEIKTIYRNNQNQIYILRKCYRTLFRAEKWQLDKLSANDLKWQQTKEIKSFFNDPKIKSETTIGLENQLIVGGIKTQLNNSEFVLKKISEEFTNSVVIADTLISEEFKQRYIVSNIDQSQLLHVVVGQQKTNLYVKIKSFDTSLSIIKSGKFNLEIPQKNSEILSVISPENDLVYFLIRHSPKSESIFSYDIYKYSLVACDLNSHQYKEFEITLPEKNITDIGIKQNLNG